MYRPLLLIALLLYGFVHCQTPPLKVSKNKRFLVQQDGTPFFWMADTAWELTHRCSREEIDYYLEKRHTQGFNVIQTVALAELDGLHTPNREGHLPLLADDPSQPNPDYFSLIDYLLEKAQIRGMYIALLPTWGDKVFTESWGVGPEVFHEENALAYGQWLGKRYAGVTNLIWIIGGDRNPRAGSGDVSIWNALAEGIVQGTGDNGKALMSFHPQPKNGGGSSTWFHNEEWLDFNMHQTGHCNSEPSYLKIRHDYELKPVKPVLDGEPLYEAHPLCFNASELGYSTTSEIRRIMFQNVFAGAFGQTYGCHAVWQMYQPGREPINGPLGPWQASLDLPMATQVKHLKDLMLSRPFLSRIPDPEMLMEEKTETVMSPVATRDSRGRYAMVYLPQGEKVTLNLRALKGDVLRLWWYDPRSGSACPVEELKREENMVFMPPATGSDWVLVLDDASQNYPPPGRPVHTP
ncbi:glycoside hydrolase family 140 protein [Robiginitalea sediminis]|uniref:glycoside hydrolase family 140 protein n=1 Tax=Robiginitalea sediminis TaxID=1982593 RepID=UPI000B4B9E9A|nr:glycoside hydrolase family 140 protein [Robiginitalea sediminis]